LSSKIFKKVTRSFTAGEIIFLQGGPSDGIYSLQKGKVSVYKTKASASGSVDIEIAQLGPGSLFGEMGMLDHTPRDASVKALEFSEVIIITREMFESQMAALPPWIMNFIKILVSRLRTTNEKLTAGMQLMEANGIKFGDEGPSAIPLDPSAISPAPPGT
jgi:CRP-like cAMP-binding protein